MLLEEDEGLMVMILSALNGMFCLLFWVLEDSRKRPKIKKWIGNLNFKSDSSLSCLQKKRSRKPFDHDTT